MGQVHKQLTRPSMQRKMFSMARTSPTDLVRSKFSTSEIQSRALAYLSDDMLQNIPEDENAYSLFQGFQASFPELTDEVVDMEGRIEVAQELVDEAESLAAATAAPARTDEDDLVTDQDVDEFMSKSIYEKIPATTNAASRSKRHKANRRKSMPILHEHFDPGFNIREIKAHADQITALDFDMPFGTMVSASLDDTVKVWDLNAGRCIGSLEGHTASVRALQVEDNILVTGSADATVRLWDLSKAHYDPQGSRFGRDDEEDDGMAFENPDDQPVDPPEGSMADCPLFVLQSHVDEITALHLRGDTLVSGSSDKTLRQWDLEKGRCIQTLDVMWAAAQASASLGSGEATWRQTSRQASGAADFVGALQVFESALACGTADGMIWDLRTGSIFDAYAYDNPITSMMFDSRRIASAACEDVVKVYDKMESRQWDCGAGITETEDGRTPAIVDHVRIKEGYMVEGRRDGLIGVWAC
ncbi:hypothetical protein ONZ43_g1680 [Nemania bipapillata]|uniref:Uncharacterized protein n=1 Tax=Nemania bipapillata TaxID=110536 RepID=A0ACC2J3E8_9PEZI|nr:hypothetical protein ONZ43_g1680 [Nemania bipapillata]